MGLRLVTLVLLALCKASALSHLQLAHLMFLRVQTPQTSCTVGAERGLRYGLDVLARTQVRFTSQRTKKKIQRNTDSFQAIAATTAAEGKICKTDQLRLRAKQSFYCDRRAYDYVPAAVHAGGLIMLG